MTKTTATKKTAAKGTTKVRTVRTPKAATKATPKAQKAAKATNPAPAGPTPAPGLVPGNRELFAAALDTLLDAGSKGPKAVAAAAEVVAKVRDRLVKAISNGAGRRKTADGLTGVAVKILKALETPQAASDLIAAGVASNRRVRVVMSELESNGFVERYGADGRRILFQTTAAGTAAAA
jgi:hypothetical protein